MRVIRLAAALLLMLALSACETMSAVQTETLRREGAQPLRILLMPVDAELSELSASGSAEVNAEWTLKGRENLRTGLIRHLGAINAHFVEYIPPPEGTALFDHLHQVEKLHSAVGGTIRAHYLHQAQRLPTKSGRFDYSLGPAVARLGDHAQADYALFVHVRDSYSAPGRVAMQVAAAVLFGVALQGGVQSGYASLVDLRTGDVVWFNVLHRGVGDLREPEAAMDTVARLLEKMPK